MLIQTAMQVTDHERLLRKTARLYYEQELTQSDISRRLRISRQKVQRLLKEARDTGVVQILIRPRLDGFDDVERELERRYFLREAIIVETTDSEDYETVTREVGVGAAEYLQRVLDAKDVITISWGGSLLGMIRALEASRASPGVNRVKVVQGLGGLGDPNNEVHAADLTRRLAKILAAEASLLPAPGVAGSEAAGVAFREDPNVQTTLAQAAGANLAFFGIGAPRQDSILIQKGTIVDWGELSQLEGRGAVGDINLRFFDSQGKGVSSDLDRRVVGLNLSEIKEINTVVGVAGGMPKLAAIRGALAGGLINVLVTDHITAQQLTEEPLHGARRAGK